jgi:hypothetical protein
MWGNMILNDFDSFMKWLACSGKKRWRPEEEALGSSSA